MCSRSGAVDLGQSICSRSGAVDMEESMCCFSLPAVHHSGSPLGIQRTGQHLRSILGVRLQRPTWNAVFLSAPGLLSAALVAVTLDVPDIRTPLSSPQQQRPRREARGMARS